MRWRRSFRASGRSAELRSQECLVYRVHRTPPKSPSNSCSTRCMWTMRLSDLHRQAPYLAAYRLRREKEGLTDGAVEVEIFRSFTE